jgi:hypothetical protein
MIHSVIGIVYDGTCRGLGVPADAHAPLHYVIGNTDVVRIRVIDNAGVPISLAGAVLTMRIVRSTSAGGGGGPGAGYGGTGYGPMNSAGAMGGGTCVTALGVPVGASGGCGCGGGGCGACGGEGFPEINATQAVTAALQCAPVYVVTGTVLIELDGTAEFPIPGNTFAMFPPGRYVYDISMVKSGNRDTVVPLSVFYVEPSSAFM